MRRRGWVAGLLTFFVCGLGQLYAGRWRRALAFFVFDLVALAACMLVFLHIRTRPLNLWTGGGSYLWWRAGAVLDAVLLARHASEGFRPRWFTRWYVQLSVLAFYQFLAALQIAMFLRDHVVEAFRVNARSMSDTLIDGDRFLVDKLLPWEPARGDVVVYRAAPDGIAVNLVHRVVGLPGERVEVRGSRAWIDGHALEEPHVRDDGERDRPGFGPVVVPPGHYFLLGDWRDASRDSRTPEIGFVPRERILAQAMTIADSEDRETGEYRWNRIGRVIR